MKSKAKGKNIFCLISALIVLSIFLTLPAIAQRIIVSEAKPVLIQAQEGETEELLPVGLISEEPIEYIERDYSILTQEYDAVTPSTFSIISLNGDQGMEINPLLLDSEPVLISPAPANNTTYPTPLMAFPSPYSYLGHFNGYLTDYSPILSGTSNIFRYNLQNNAYTYNYNYNYKNLACRNLFGWYGLPFGQEIISAWAGNIYNNFNRFEQCLPNSYAYLNNHSFNIMDNNNKPNPDPPVQLKEADVEIYADADGSIITLSEGETLSIVLASNITTGYRWDLNDDLLDSQVLAQVNAQYLSGPIHGDEPLLGAGGYEQWIFEGTGCGTTTVELNYKRSWDEEIADTFTIEVIVQPAGEMEGEIGLANPASVYCIENGGISEIRTNEFGSYGVCIFNDGTECDEWAYFRGECGQ